MDEHVSKHAEESIPDNFKGDGVLPLVLDRDELAKLIFVCRPESNMQNMFNSLSHFEPFLFVPDSIWSILHYIRSISVQYIVLKPDYVNVVICSAILRMAAECSPDASEQIRDRARSKATGITLVSGQRGEVQTAFCGGGLPMVYYQHEGSKMIATIDFLDIVEIATMHLGRKHPKGILTRTRTLMNGDGAAMGNL